MLDIANREQQYNTEKKNLCYTDPQTVQDDFAKNLLIYLIAGSELIDYGTPCLTIISLFF